MQDQAAEADGPLSATPENMGAHNGDLSDKLQKDITTQRQDATFNALHMEVQAVRLNQPLPDKRASWWDTSHPHDQEFKPDEYNSCATVAPLQRPSPRCRTTCSYG